MNESQNNYDEYKKATHGYILYDSIHLKFWKTKPNNHGWKHFSFACSKWGDAGSNNRGGFGVADTDLPDGADDFTGA